MPPKSMFDVRASSVVAGASWSLVCGSWCMCGSRFTCTAVQSLNCTTVCTHWATATPTELTAAPLVSRVRAHATATATVIATSLYYVSISKIETVHL